MTLRLVPTRIAIIISFFLAPFWLKFPDAPKPFTSDYVLGFVIVAFMLLAIVLWGLSGFVGWRNLFTNRWKMAWLFFLIVLTGWNLISQEWAFGRNLYAGMAQTAALQLVIIAAFTITVAATAPPPRVIFLVLIISMLFHGAIGGFQVYLQHEIGLDSLGEFPLDPSKSGVSVLESAGMRWLRPYGFLPHPNILAGIIVLGLLASVVYVIKGKYTFPAMAVFAIGLYFLLLTFSRGAWIGFVVALICALPFVMKEKGFWRRILPLGGLSIIVGMIFVSLYHPFLLSRTGMSEVNTEQRSISDRLVFMEIAWDAIKTYPVRGIGTGNFPWYASNYLFFRTVYDLDGNNVHNIYLTVWSELGIIGFMLFLGMLFTGILAALQNRQVENIALIACFVAWLIIGFVEHYMWTLVFTQALWFGILAAALQPSEKPL